MSCSRQRLFSVFRFPSALSSWKTQAPAPPLNQWEMTFLYLPHPLILFSFLFFFFFFCQSLLPAFVSAFPLMSCQSPILSFGFPILFFPLFSPQAFLIFSRVFLFILTGILYLTRATLLSGTLFLKGYSKLTRSSFFT